MGITVLDRGFLAIPALSISPAGEVDLLVMDPVPALPTTALVVHHLYRRPSDTLLACGVTPGPLSLAPDTEWHTGHEHHKLLDVVSRYECWCCSVCLNLAKGEGQEDDQVDDELESHDDA